MSRWWIAYLMVGPATWGFIWLAYVFANSRLKRLESWRKPLPSAPPRVTIVIPAKDEAADIELCLRSVLSQDYPSFEVVAVNDRSRDETGAIFDRYAASAITATSLTPVPRGEGVKHSIPDAPITFRAIHIPPDGLPPGWLGKCNALYTATRGIDTPWLLFVDSDVSLEPAALSSVMSLALDRECDAISILTRLECRNFLEQMMLPLLAGSWAVMHAVSLTNQDSKPHRAEANGQFFLIRREAYEAVGGHAIVKDCITEDVELARTLKAAKFKIRLYLGSHLAATRMHATFSQMLHGWSRIYSGTARRRPWRILTTMLVILLTVDSIWPAMVLGSIHPFLGSLTFSWSIFALHFLAMTLFLRLFYVKSYNPGWQALLAPISTALMFVILIYSLRKCQTGKIVWRDTAFQQKSSAS